MDLQMKWPGIQIVVNLLSTPWLERNKPTNGIWCVDLCISEAPILTMADFHQLPKAALKICFPLQVFFSFEVKFRSCWSWYMDMNRAERRLKINRWPSRVWLSFDTKNRMCQDRRWKSRKIGRLKQRHQLQDTWWTRGERNDRLGGHLASSRLTEVYTSRKWVSSCFIHTLTCPFVTQPDLPRVYSNPRFVSEIFGSIPKPSTSQGRSCPVGVACVANGCRTSATFGYSCQKASWTQLLRARRRRSEADGVWMVQWLTFQIVKIANASRICTGWYLSVFLMAIFP